MDDEDEERESCCFGPCGKLCPCCCLYMYDGAAKTHPHVSYGQLLQDEHPKLLHIDQKQSTHAPPVRKSYKYPQQQQEYVIPPQFEVQGGKLVKDQPSPTRYRTTEELAGGEEYSSDNEPDFDGRRREKRLSLSKIDRSPESSLRRGMEHIVFPPRVSPLDPSLSDFTSERREKKLSLSKIDRSPESTLGRGTQNIVFPPTGPIMGSLDPALFLQYLKPEDNPLTSRVYYSLYHDAKEAALVVQVARVVGLPSQKPEITSNAFVQLYLLPSKGDGYQSQCIEGTHCPVFNEVFRFPLSLEVLKEQMLVMRFYGSINRFVGGVLCTLRWADVMGGETVEPITAFDEDESLKESFQGDILLKMSYDSKAHSLEVLLLEVSNLKELDLLRLPNPYVKINLICDGQRVDKWTSATKRSTTNPVFNELCKMDLSQLDIRNIQCDLLVMNYERYGHDSELGSVSFGESVSHNSGLLHWKKVLVSDRKVCWWHPVVSGRDIYRPPSLLSPE